MKERPWAEHLTTLSKSGVGTLSSVAAFNHERVCEVSYCRYAWRVLAMQSSLRGWCSFE